MRIAAPKVKWKRGTIYTRQPITVLVLLSEKKTVTINIGAIGARFLNAVMTSRGLHFIVGYGTPPFSVSNHTSSPANTSCEVRKMN